MNSDELPIIIRILIIILVILYFLLFNDDKIIKQ